MVDLTGHHRNKELLWWIKGLHLARSDARADDRVAELQDDVDDGNDGRCDGNAPNTTLARRRGNVAGGKEVRWKGGGGGGREGRTSLAETLGTRRMKKAEAKKGGYKKAKNGKMETEGQRNRKVQR